MTNMRRIVVSGLLIVSVSVLHAQNAVLPENVRAAADRITAAKLADDLALLSTDSQPGRFDTSPSCSSRLILQRAAPCRNGIFVAADDGPFP